MFQPVVVLVKQIAMKRLLPWKSYEKMMASSLKIDKG
jgi:hypothetical protein